MTAAKCYRCGAPHLMPREVELAKLVAQSLSNKEIAARMGLTCGSVKEYLFRLYPRVGVTNRTELALWWVGQKKAL